MEPYGGLLDDKGNSSHAKTIAALDGELLIMPALMTPSTRSKMQVASIPLTGDPSKKQSRKRPFL